MWRRLPPGIFEALAVSFFFGLVWYVLNLNGIVEEANAQLAFATVGALVIFGVYQRQRAQTAERLVQSGLGEVGIERVYRSIDDALPDLVAALRTAKLVCAYLQIGGLMLGGPHAPLFQSLEKRRDDLALSVELIVVDKASPFVSEHRLQDRRHDVAVARNSLDSVHRQIEVLRGMFGKRLDVRFHQEPFGWSVFFADDAAYLSGYFAERENRPPIYKLRKRDGSLYLLFEKHFKDLQEQYPRL